MNSELLLAAGGVLLALAVLWPFLRGASTKSTIELLQTELAAFRAALTDQEVRHQSKLREQADLAESRDRRCASDIAELRGQLKTATESFARVIAQEVVAAIQQNGKSGG